MEKEKIATTSHYQNVTAYVQDIKLNPQIVIP